MGLNTPDLSSSFPCRGSMLAWGHHTQSSYRANILRDATGGLRLQASIRFGTQARVADLVRQIPVQIWGSKSVKGSCFKNRQQCRTCLCEVIKCSFCGDQRFEPASNQRSGRPSLSHQKADISGPQVHFAKESLHLAEHQKDIRGTYFEHAKAGCSCCFGTSRLASCTCGS